MSLHLLCHSSLMSFISNVFSSLISFNLCCHFISNISSFFVSFNLICHFISDVNLSLESFNLLNHIISNVIYSLTSLHLQYDVTSSLMSFHLSSSRKGCVKLSRISSVRSIWPQDLYKVLLFSVVIERCLCQIHPSPPPPSPPSSESRIPLFLSLAACPHIIP